MTPEVERIVAHVEATPVLLVATDFDGVLAPIVEDHLAAEAEYQSVALLMEIAAIPHTHVAVISGRALQDLRARLPELTSAWMAGSHGAEMDPMIAPTLTEDQERALARVGERLERCAARYPGGRLEVKPRGVAFHYRNVPDTMVAGALHDASSLQHEFPGLTMRLGSMVVEFSADAGGKGDAIRTARYLSGASSVVFLGDDLTDEHGFGALGQKDAGVKVGIGHSLAGFHVPGIQAVPELLARLCEARRKWAAGRQLEPLEHHSVISDQRTLAVVSRRGRIVWFCAPRVDSSSVFAELIGGPDAGYFEVSPAGQAGIGDQRYVDDTNVVKTSWGACSVTDYFDCAAGRAFQRAGRSDLIRVVEGAGRAIVRFAPRLDFGRVTTTMLDRGGGVLEVDGAHDPIILFAQGVTWRIEQEKGREVAVAELDLSAGPVTLELRYGTGNIKPHPRAEPDRRMETERFWRGWAGSLKLPSTRPDLVKRSALMLKALCHGPSGAIAAAGTTSLPEHLGGVRNWDYRYCWPRDAALACAALAKLGNSGVAMRFLDWLLGVIDRCESPDRLRPIYTVTGSNLGPEAEIGDLCGYGESRPVRIGNAAANQVQLDVFGPIVDLVALLAESGAPISPDHWRLTRAMVEAVQQRWMEPDHGIWEIRGPKRKHVHSRVMCWHTVNRAMCVQEQVMGTSNPSWAALRDEIAADVLANGYNERAKAFTTAYGSEATDAAALAIGLTGLIPSTDERFMRTVEGVERSLKKGPTVYRYLCDDGLPGREGGFHLCTSWLIEALILVGRREYARSLFGELVALAGPTGVMAEEYEPVYKIALGNLPQAYSHLAVINSAVALG